MTLANYLMRTAGAPVLRALMEETVIHYPLGNLTAGEEVGVLVALDAELGTNQEVGDGPIPRGPQGERERRSGHLEARKELAVTKDSQWLIDGELWMTQRRTGKDTAGGVYQGWLITSQVKHTTQHSLAKGDRPLRRQ